jgi:superfamily II DNA/RNA helicase
MSPTPIQYFSLVTVLKNPETNVIAQSKSGTGKTLAFLGILLQKFINFNIISN